MKLITRAINVYNKKYGRDLMQSSYRWVTAALDEVVDNILKERGIFQEPPKTIKIEELLEMVRSKTHNRSYNMEQLIDALVEWKHKYDKDYLTLPKGAISVRLPEIIKLLYRRRGGSRRKSRRNKKSRKSFRR